MIDGVFISGKKVDRDMAKRLAEEFDSQILSELPKNKDSRYFVLDKDGLTFCCENQELRGDFTRLLPRVTGGHLQHEILLKVAKPADAAGTLPRAVDATAGLGEDSFILAACGYRVEMFEHNPITAALLKDALIRGKRDPKTKDIVSQMSLTRGDSKELIKNLNYVPEVIYLDPMYPEKKKSAQSKKKLQVLHMIEAPCADEAELMEAALATGAKKIIIKRPPEADFLAGKEPSYSVERKAVRYDCIVSG